ncbi:hypothetical protein AALA99_06510 [Anaerotruncus colihominis]|uniref:hypothetical protein n=1 Tax=Anaerotruncus TaxID=244127 RepID=UPI00216CE814|nr:MULTISPECIES: hypothetical protein [Anaerotruncus]MCI8492185.1 hypothetical protein [Anaerotruncus sp.]
MKTKWLSLLAAMMMLIALAACGGADMPMEATLDGYTIVLGQTTVQDLVDRGYEAHLEKMPDVARDGDKYISFHYSLDRGAGDQIFVTVSVPWSGNTDITAETKLSTSAGILQAVTFTKTATEKVEALYNGVSVQDLSFDFAAQEWGAKEKKDASKKTYTLQAKRGFVQFQSHLTGDEDFHSVSVTLSDKEFEKMQK